MKKKSQSKTSKSRLLGMSQKVGELGTIITALLYGRSGTGKTTLSGTFPKLLVLDIGERGTDSISDTDAEVIKITDWQQFEDVFFELREGNHDFKSVSVDSLHSLQALAIRKVKADAKKNDDDQTSQRDFGQASGLMNQWLLNYRDLRDNDINVVFLCHDKVSEYDGEDDEQITPEVGPRLMPSVASTVVGAVNLIGYTFIRQAEAEKKKLGQKKVEPKKEYCLRVGPNALYTTKVRRAKSSAIKTPEFIVDPTYGKLKELIKPQNDSAKSKRVSKRKTK